MTGAVGPAARLLGFAGLLPQLLAVALIVLGDRGDGGLGWVSLLLGLVIATIYPAIILSFLGGMWWGFAMRRTAGQGRLAAVAVLPSLVAAACVGWAAVTLQEGGPWPLIALGSAVLLTLPVDRHLVTTGEAPAGWMSLRVPLSIGLGGLTIAAALLLVAGAR